MNVSLYSLPDETLANVAASFVPVLFLLILLIKASLNDIQNRRISDKMIVWGIGGRFVFLAVFSTSVRAFWYMSLYCLLGSLIIFIPLTCIVLVAEFISRREMFGGGDLKLFFVVGLYFEYSQTFSCLALTCFLSAMFWLIRECDRCRKGIAMATYITVSTVLVSVCQFLKM